MKRGHLWVDWVELGCRGWEIDATGAEAAALGCCEDDCAHLDRTTLHVIYGGCRRFLASVTCDLIAAGIMRVRDEYVRAAAETMGTARLPVITDFRMTLPAATDGVGSSTPARVWIAEWTHPSGGFIRATLAPKRSWWQRVKQWYTATTLAQLVAFIGELERRETAHRSAVLRAPKSGDQAA